MHYEITDTSVNMRDISGNDLGFHPVFVVEGDTEDDAILDVVLTTKRDPKDLVVKEVK